MTIKLLDKQCGIVDCYGSYSKSTKIGSKFQPMAAHVSWNIFKPSLSMILLPLLLKILFLNVFDCFLRSSEASS